jgi:hypothetical protein
MAFRYLKTMDFNRRLGVGPDGRNPSNNRRSPLNPYSDINYSKGFSGLSTVSNYCRNGKRPIIECIFNFRNQTTPTPPIGGETIFYYSNGAPVPTSDATITPDSYLVNGKTRNDLQSVDIGTSCTSIGTSAPLSFADACFINCTNLNIITISDTVTYIGWRCFQNCTGLASIIIPDSVTSLGEISGSNNGGYCFAGCTGLEFIKISNSVTILTPNCFGSCIGLTSITIPDSVTTIDAVCFGGCTGLTSITIPSNVTIIGQRSFDGCTGLKEVIFNDPTKITENIIDMLLNITTDVTITFYNTDNWNDLNTYVSYYFTETPQINWIYIFQPGPPPS